MNINGYVTEGDWKPANRGFTVKATKDGKKYFLKKYGMYKKPRHDKSTSDALYKRMMGEFESFMDNRVKINKTLADLASTGGNIILPTNWFVDDTCYIEATAFVDNLIEDEDILKLSTDDKVYVMLTAAAAVNNIHKKKIIHSDLKRTNILAAKNSSGRISAKIIDFDTSYFEGEARAEEMGGDQNFMSPELAQCFMYDMADDVLENMTTKSDIFSLGLVFHDYLVTEKYKGEDGKTHVKGCHPAITGLKGKLKERQEAGKTVYCCEALLSDGKLIVSDKIKEKYLRHLIAVMIQPEPEDRPTAAEVLDALRNKKILPLKPGAVEIAGESGKTESGKTESMETVSGGEKAFCKPWSEHAVIFNEDKLLSLGYVGSEQVDKSGNKCYYLYKKDGSKRLFTFENLLLLGMISRTGASGGTARKGASDSGRESHTDAEPAAKTGTDITVYEDGKLWDEDSDYKFDMESVTGSGYKSAARAERKGLKGYVLIKHTGDLRFMTVDKLKLLRFVVKK